jgi:hypothetical protein
VALQALGANIIQCLPAKPSQTYYFGYRYKDSGGATASGTATADISFLPAGNSCELSESTGGSVAAQSYNSNNWIQGSSSATSPSNTTHIIFHISSPASNGYYDQLYLSTSTPGLPAF